MDLSSKKVMGVINLTPDSFYKGSRLKEPKAVIKTAEKMLEDGAFFVDIGGYSSRPGATNITEQEELERVVAHIAAIRKLLPELYISIDTFRAKVAEEAINHGADIINDISAGDLDDKMFELVQRLKVPYIAMHMRGTPQNMVSKSKYDHATQEVFKHLKSKCLELQALGIHDIIIDPGFGFAKTSDQSFELLKNLQIIKNIGHPILAGLSRKSMIYKNLEVGPGDALNGTSVLNTIALRNGADILRVHDVKEAAETIKLFNLTYS